MCVWVWVCGCAGVYIYIYIYVSVRVRCPTLLIKDHLPLLPSLIQFTFVYFFIFVAQLYITGREQRYATRFIG